MPPTEATNMSQDAKLFRRGGAEFADYWEACKKRNRELVIARQKALQAAGYSRHIREQGDIRTHFSRKDFREDWSSVVEKSQTPKRN